ncbi:TPA: hypothetical protein MIX12_29870 [Klebsiella pneumoniae]|nr:hypothetical protein [Klebsiella pneumoniae]
MVFLKNGNILNTLFLTRLRQRRLMIKPVKYLVAERQEVESHFRQTHRRRALFMAQGPGMSLIVS